LFCLPGPFGCNLESFQVYSKYRIVLKALRGCFRNGKATVESYHETLELERRIASKHPVNHGLLKRQMAAPRCALFDIFENEYRPLILPSERSKPTAILFWSKWCHSSKKTLGRFIKFAKTHYSQVCKIFSVYYYKHYYNSVYYYNTHFYNTLL